MMASMYDLMYPAANPQAVKQEAPIPVPGQPGAPANPNVSGWQQFLDTLATDTNLQQSLLTAGAAMLQPRAPGQSHMGKIGEGAVVGMQDYRQSQKDDDEKRRRDVLLDLQKRQTTLAEKEQREASASRARGDTRQDATGAAYVRQVDTQTSVSALRNSPEMIELEKQRLQAMVAAAQMETDPERRKLLDEQIRAQTAALQKQTQELNRQAELGLSGNAEIDRVSQLAKHFRATNPALDESGAYIVAANVYNPPPAGRMRKTPYEVYLDALGEEKDMPSMEERITGAGAEPTRTRAAAVAQAYAQATGQTFSLGEITPPPAGSGVPAPGVPAAAPAPTSAAPTGVAPGMEPLSAAAVLQMYPHLRTEITQIAKANGNNTVTQSQLARLLNLRGQPSVRPQ